MTRSKYTNRIVAAAVAAMVAILVVMSVAISQGAIALDSAEYAERLFSANEVHNIDIQVSEDEWQDMLDNASKEEYILVDVVIDGTTVSGVGLRPKGNSSLAAIASSDSNRYSFKVEFDHYVDGRNYLGLDKLVLNNIAQDSTYLKDYLTYHLMNEMGAYAPLCSFIWVTVNGEDWGLYLAVESVEDSFVQRVYGTNQAEVYKPDTMDMNAGGGMGDGAGGFPEGGFPGGGQMPEDFDASQMPDMSQMPENFGGFPEGGFPGGGQIPEGQGFTLPEGVNTGELPEGFANRGDAAGGDASNGGDATGGNATNDMGDAASGGNAGTFGNRNNGAGGMGGDAGAGGMGAGMGAGGMGGVGNNSAVALIYTNDEISSYSAIFDNAATKPSKADKNRLISSLKQLNAGENLEGVLNTDEVISYFAVHNFVLNSDSYTGNMTHNYYLAEVDGRLSMIAWDYNLAFGGMGGGGMGAGGMGGAAAAGGTDATNASTDTATSYVNYPIDSPLLSASMESRPMISWIFENEEYLTRYHDELAALAAYLESDQFKEFYTNTVTLISPYVAKDPSSFTTLEGFEKAAATLLEFCLLRAESIQGQLDGSVASTSDGQTASNNKGFINASHLDINSMGSNNMGFNRTRNEGRE